jgi:tetratricopeptide (TPR) repeat protein
MSGYILCQVKKAEKPFYIENISTNIYSIEELCYYLYNNLYLVDRSLISNKLCTWLDEELKLPKLAAKLRPFIGKEAGLEEILYPIFKEINYLAYEELRILNGRIERRNKESEEIREKRKGDALMENRMYVNAIRVYQKLLEKDSREISREMRERILHNQGCAYSYLFQMDKAQDCFFAAWKVNQSEKALKIYLLAYRSVHTPEEFEKIQEDLKAEDSVKKETARALEQFISLPEQKIAPGETDRILEDLTREYHRSTGS